MVHAPGLTTAGSRSESLVELVDLLPTLCELTGISIPASVQGKSVVAVLEDPQVSIKKVAYTVVTRGEKLGLAIRGQRWRYAVWGESGAELYDLRRDPGEIRNLVGMDREQQVQRMKRLLETTRGLAVPK
jgi:iduronate 2-sulfatase